jgi:hypothetical protein
MIMSMSALVKGRNELQDSFDLGNGTAVTGMTAASEVDC